MKREWLPIKILADKSVELHGQRLPLNQAQQQLVANYATSIRALVPEVRELALSGIELALAGAAMPLNELLGADNRVSQQLTTELTNLKLDVNRHFTSGTAININHSADASADFFDEQFEARIEQIIETAVQQSLANFSAAFGSSLVLGAAETARFVQRMTQFGEHMAAQIEAVSPALAQHGAALCDSLLVVDSAEELLKRELPELQGFNLITPEAANTHPDPQHTI